MDFLRRGLGVLFLVVSLNGTEGASFFQLSPEEEIFEAVHGVPGMNDAARWIGEVRVVNRGVTSNSGISFLECEILDVFRGSGEPGDRVAFFLPHERRFKNAHGKSMVQRALGAYAGRVGDRLIIFSRGGPQSLQPGQVPKTSSVVDLEWFLYRVHDDGRVSYAGHRGVYRGGRTAFSRSQELETRDGFIGEIFRSMN